MKNCFLLALLTSFAACSSSLKKEPNVLIIGNGDDVMVTLSIVDNKNIDKIEFYSGHESISVGKKEILKNDEFIFNFNNNGEGLFKTCIFTSNDTFCTECYVEKGYSPKMKFVEDSLIIIDIIGFEYD